MDGAGGFDVTVPNVARMYDYALGGKDNFAADREAADAIAKIDPGAFQAAHDNRRFLRRAVGYVAGQGVTQFIDIGSGLPTAENTHEVARGITSSSRVAYVDNDPVVVGHATALLADNSASIAVSGDLRDPDRILSDPALSGFLDLRQPFAVVAIAVLHFLEDPAAYEVVNRLTEVMPGGSYLIISHATADKASADEVGKVQSEYERASAALTMRSRAQVARFFDGLELADPGVTDISAWRNPEGKPAARTICYGGVARKPA